MLTLTRQSIGPTRTQSLSAVWNIIEPAAAESKAVPTPVPKGSKGKSAAGPVHDLGQAFSNERALRILKRGISSQVIAPLSDYLAIGKGELVGMLDMDRTTALRRAGKDLPLPTHSAENVLRLLELKDIARDTFESEDAALGWLRRPHPMLDGESPLESAKTSFGSRRVKDILVAIKYGGVV
jgi:putative toxin-antitoxin system antitoxin component (TIGR02293 family)